MPDQAPRVAVVTGAARGIGAATAKRLAADGLSVAVLDLKEGDCQDTVDAITGAGGQALAVGCDVSQAGQVADAVAAVAERLGPPVVLVNNAGMTAATAARVGVEFADFQQAAAARIPVRRVGRPEDVAHVASFLASEGAGFVSGQVIYVAGGPLC